MPVEALAALARDTEAEVRWAAADSAAALLEDLGTIVRRRSRGGADA